MDRGQAAGVAAEHRLNHVQGFTASHFAHDNSIGPHPQGVGEEFPNRQTAVTVPPPVFGLQIHDVRLKEP